jgi:hypothetical protein
MLRLKELGQVLLWFVVQGFYISGVLGFCALVGGLIGTIIDPYALPTMGLIIGAVIGMWALFLLDNPIERFWPEDWA